MTRIYNILDYSNVVITTIKAQASQIPLILEKNFNHYYNRYAKEVR